MNHSNQVPINAGPRVRWQNDEGGWEVGRLLLYPNSQQPLQVLPSFTRMVCVQRYYHGDVVCVRDYAIVNEPHEEA